MPMTTTSYAVLGLLSVRPWTTYELAKQVQRSLNWFWPRAERKLYDEPKLLVAAGFATATREFTGQRPRTLYTITDAGREALRRWLDEPSAPRMSEFEAMVKVFFADAGSLDQLRATVDATEASARDRVAALGELVDRSLTEGPVFPERRHISALTLRLQLAQETAVIDWTAWARNQLSSWTSTTDPANWDDRAALTELRGRIRATLEAR
jgi:PadR family transcriptional regulator, regulatory protein AphA